MGLFDKLFRGKNSENKPPASKKVKQVIFNEVTEFDFSDFENLKENKNYYRFHAGNLRISSGRVVCADPLFRELGLPQTWTVAPGEYPVFLYIGLDDEFEGLIAYAELSFKDEIPVRWEFSLIAEHLLQNDLEKKINGMFPVENGLGSFSDFETWKIHNQEIVTFYEQYPEGNYYSDELERHFRENANTPECSRGEDWINYKPSNANANIIMFGSGAGDGIYPRYAGYDKNGQVIKLIVDFIQLTDEE